MIPTVTPDLRLLADDLTGALDTAAELTALCGPVLTLQALGLGTEAGDRSVLEAAHGFCTGLGIEMRLSRLGVPEADLPAMAEQAHAIRRLLDNNPRDISREQILAIYRAAY